MRILGDFANSQILDAAIEYDFFTFIDKGFQTSEEIARASRHGSRVPRGSCSTACRHLGLVEKRDGEYFLTPTAKAFLVRGKPSYVGDFRHVALALWDGMAHLKESLKTGKPLSRMDTGGGVAGMGKARARHYRHRRAGSQRRYAIFLRSARSERASRFSTSPAARASSA